MAALSRCSGTQNAHPATARLRAALRLALNPDPRF
jgi:hypothetical protein